ncbi:MAG: alginate export family protein [Elusimicrobia bacterium]|nr:alginate export family protein [Elusimicrobiota bacterium]
MKKLLGAALSAALILPAGTAGAELLKNLKVGGQLDIQANSAINTRDFVTNGTGNNDRLGSAVTRVLLNANWDLLDDVHARVTLRKNDRAWGDTSGGGSGQGSDSGQSQAVGSGGIQGNTYVNESFIKVDKLLGQGDVTVGRQFFGNAGDPIVYFGPKDNYGLAVQALDAFRLDCGHDWGNVTGVVGKIAGDTISGALPDSGTDIRGLDVGIKNLPVKANVVLYNQVTHRNGTLGTPEGFGDYLWVYGFKLKGEALGGWLGAEFYQNSGENRTGGSPTASANYSGRAFAFDAGYKADIADVAGLTPWFNFGFGTGRSDSTSNKNDGFTAINPDWRPGIINGRFSSTIANHILGGGGYGGYVPTVGLNNRVVYGVGLKVNPAKLSKLTAGVQYWNYNLQRRTVGDAVLDPNTGAAKGNRHIGAEFGVTADWQHSENVGVGLGWATFQPGGFIKSQQTAHSPARLLFADLKVKF